MDAKRLEEIRAWEERPPTFQQTNMEYAHRGTSVYVAELRQGVRELLAEVERQREILRWVRDGQGGQGVGYVHRVVCDCPVCEAVPR